MMYDQSTWELNVMREFYKLKAIDYTDKAKAVNTALTSSSSDADWLQAALKVIRYENPAVDGGLFHGRLTINGTSKFGYFEVFIYSISDSSQGHYLPSYCIGVWYRNDGTQMGFKTVNGVFTSRNLTPEIQSGKVTFSSIATNSYADKTITFSPAFSATPNVVASLSTAGTAGNIGNVSVSVHTISTTKATIRVFNNRGGALSPAVEWIAVRP